MNYYEFINKYNGKAIDYDGAAGVQCVDLIKLYLKEVFNIAQFSVNGSARNYYEQYSSFPALVKNFEKIPNTPDFIPQKGDICVFNGTVGAGNGHVSIATGEGTTSYFFSYDMNWNGKACHKVKHKYTSEGFLGVLRAKEQDMITGAEYFSIYSGDSTSVVDALRAVSADFSFAYRSKIAKANGIAAYVGTAKQNTQMLTLLKQGKLVKP